jgi:hypothetical protein
MISNLALKRSTIKQAVAGPAAEEKEVLYGQEEGEEGSANQ